MKTKSTDGGWWKDFYEDTPFEVFMERRDPLELAKTIAFLTEALKLSQGERVFDQCCGFGSLSVPLFESGFKVCGVDLCEKYIQIARERTKFAEDASFHCADAFEFVAPRPCDAAFNWYTSFGYSDDDKVNARMLQRAFDSLRPNGIFALEYPNMAFLLANFRQQICSEQETELGRFRIVRDCKVDMERGLLMQHWLHEPPDGRTLTKDTTLRVYLPHTIAGLLKSCGFVDVSMFGGIEFEPLKIDSPRCVITARKRS
jgi:SAM-dependent methyltransferase